MDSNVFYQSHENKPSLSLTPQIHNVSEEQPRIIYTWLFRKQATLTINGPCQDQWLTKSNGYKAKYKLVFRA